LEEHANGSNKGRSLEEVDELFEVPGLKAWRFKDYETHGTGRVIRVIEQEGVPTEKTRAAQIEENDLGTK
jgi:hypothetical protein